MTLRKPSKRATRQVWYWWTSQLHMTRYGTRVLPWSYYIPSLIVISCGSSVLSSLTAALHSRQATGRSADCAVSKNGVPQGSVLAPTLFNIYLSDLPPTTSSKYAYAGDLALLYSGRSWTTVENTLSTDMDVFAKYLRTWSLKLSSAKTTATPFTLNTKEAHRQLTVKLDGSTLPCNPTPTYLGVKMDRQLTFKQHIEALRGKVASRNNLLRRLAGSSWGAYTSTLRTGALALVYSAAEYAAPAWCRSTHVKKTGCYSQRHHDNSQWMPTTNPSEIPPCPLGNCSTCTS